MDTFASPQELLSYAKQHSSDIKLSTYRLDAQRTATRIEPRNWKDLDTLADDFVRANFRKGLVLVEDESKHVAVANKGLRWHGELALAHLDSDAAARPALERERRRFLRRMEDALRPIAVTFVRAVDGEHVEVSCSGGCWVFCGTSLELFVADLSTLDVLEPTLLTTVLAKRWRDYFLNLSPEKQTELRTALETRTLVGHYADSRVNERVFHYAETQFRFSTVVDKQSHAECLPPDEARQFLDRYGLPTCEQETVVYDDYRTALRKLAARARDNLKGVGETAFVVSGFEKSPSVVWLWKMHSLEYQVLEKLKEKDRKSVV